MVQRRYVACLLPRALNLDRKWSIQLGHDVRRDLKLHVRIILFLTRGEKSEHVRPTQHRTEGTTPRTDAGFPLRQRLLCFMTASGPYRPKQAPSKRPLCHYCTLPGSEERGRETRRKRGKDRASERCPETRLAALPEARARGPAREGQPRTPSVLTHRRGGAHRRVGVIGVLSLKALLCRDYGCVSDLSFHSCT